MSEKLLRDLAKRVISAIMTNVEIQSSGTVSFIKPGRFHLDFVADLELSFADLEELDEEINRLIGELQP